jgi:uncharacterized protein
MYKLSHYLVVTEPLGEQGKKIVYSTRSGKDLIVPEVTLKYIKEGKIDMIPRQVIEKLVDSQILVDSNANELAEIILENENAIDNESNDMLYEVIQPSAMCQLGCYYCGQKHTKDYISAEVEERIIERIRQKIEQGNYKQLFIAWFGAEPLMGLRQMRELTRNLKALAANHHLTYAAKVVSNGLSLKKEIFEELVNELGVNHIEITIDGIKNYHDSHRYLKEGGGTFDIILQNLLAITSTDKLKNQCQLSIRCNVDENNHEGVTPLIELLAEHNLQNKLSFYPIGIYAWGNDAHKKSLTKEVFAKQEIIWQMEMIKNGFNVNFLRSRAKQVCLAVSKTSEMYDAFGNIFNCTEVSYVPTYEKTGYVLGNVLESQPNKQRKFSNWNQEILNKDDLPCHTCEMLPVCGGACPKSWHEDMRACPSTKFNMEERLRLKHILYTSKNQLDFSEKAAIFKAQILEYVD